jgi:hypothetical protein
MDLRGFFGRTLPPEGRYVLLVIRSSGARFNIQTESLDELVDMVDTMDRRADTTVYHAVGAFADSIITGEKVRRLQEDARAFRTLAMDVDVGAGKPYQTQQEAALAVLRAAADSGMPEPMLVSSGYGVHVYWPMSADVDPAQWVQMSTQLLALMRHTGVQVDASKVRDPSMVLRPPGSNNKKRDPWVPVRVVQEGSITAPADLQMVLANAPAEVVATLTAPAAKVAAPLSSIASAIVGDAPEYPPLAPADMEPQCAQLAEAAATGFAGNYKAWITALTVAKFCEDPLDAAHRWSEHAPDYDAAETERVLSTLHATGPSLCQTFALHNPSGCAACPHNGKIRSVAALSGASLPTTVPVPPAALVAQPAATLTLPPGYVTANRAIYRVIDGVRDLVIEYPLIVISHTTEVSQTTEARCAEIMADIPSEGWRTFLIPMKALYGRDTELAEALASRGVYLPKGRTARVGAYIVDYLKQLQQAAAAAEVYRQMGWSAREDVFVAGSTAYTATGSAPCRVGDRVRSISGSFRTEGQLANWSAAANVYNSPELRMHAFCLLAMMGAPLMRGSGLDAAVLYMYSPQSGTGKSTTGLLGLSAFGEPGRMKMQAADTHNAMMMRFSLHGSTPAYIDEVTTMDDEQMRMLLLQVTHGQQRARLHSDASLHDAVQWNTIVAASGNRDIHAGLAAAANNEGAQMRVLQVTLPPTATFSRTNAGARISALIDSNYGHAGPMLAQEIIRMGGPGKLFRAAEESMDATYKFRFEGPERFWRAIAVCAYAAGTLANRMGLVQLDVPAIMKAAVENVDILRSSVREGALDGIDLVGEFVRQLAPQIVVMKHNQDSGLQTPQYVPPTGEVVGRLDALCTNRVSFSGGSLHISSSALQQWARKRGTDQATILTQLMRDGVAVVRPSTASPNKVTLTRGTGSLGTAVRCYSISLTHPRLMSAIGSSFDNKQPAIAPLQVVPANAAQ